MSTYVHPIDQMIKYIMPRIIISLYREEIKKNKRLWLCHKTMFVYTWLYFLRFLFDFKVFSFSRFRPGYVSTIFVLFG